MSASRVFSNLIRTNVILKSNCLFKNSALCSFYSTSVTGIEFSSTTPVFFSYFGISIIKFLISDTQYQYILADKVGSEKNVGLVTLNRPKALNALCDGLISELAAAIGKLDKDESIGAIVITGSEKAFAAGLLFQPQIDYKIVLTCSIICPKFYLRSRY